MIQPRFADLLDRVMGLDAALIGVSAVDRAVAARIRACDLPDEEAYWALLQQAPGEVQALIETVVIPETWFFRDSAAFDAMVKLCAPRLADGSPPLRILSLPSSTGEEPYSIAMALLEAGWPAGRFHIDGVDISNRALTLARRGIYGRNAFRSPDLGFRDRHFEPVEREWRLKDAVRGCVHFAQGNMLDPGFLAGAAPYDVIFCRNLLIYFDAATQGRAVAVLRRLLAPKGLLLAGHSESGVVSAHGFASAQISMAFAFRRAEAPEPAKAAPKPAPAALAKPLKRAPVSRPAAPRPAVKISQPAPPPAPGLESLWTLLDSGRLEEAERACQTHIRTHGASADALMIQGLIADARGDAAGAAAAYRKVLYLDPDHGEAIGHLALLLRKQGDHARADLLTRRLTRQTGKVS
ncbi:CheR family methyltransferase [Novosphingobium terrae]|uniref:CheR family methyltransferase n=1 Tax=Novosphingobium terrae TaxID=2726189 RepID=UPI00197F88B9|nr:CheR family methyltransferase [Novosphingobium terrae]